MTEFGWLALILESGVVVVLFRAWRTERARRQLAERLLGTQIGQLIVRREQ